VDEGLGVREVGDNDSFSRKDSDPNREAGLVMFNVI
jgi:hypothetical protein